MSDQVQLIEEDGDVSQPENGVKKNKLKAGAAVAAGALAGSGAIAFDAYSETLTTEAQPIAADNKKPVADGTSTNTTPAKDSVQTILQDSTSHHTDTANEPVINHNNADVTLIPDHIAVGNAPDNLSFNEAFAEARLNLGAPALFEWQGNLYHTCHPDEYAALPEEMKNVFESVWLANEMELTGFVPANDGEIFDLPITVEDKPEDLITHETPIDSTSVEEEILSNTDDVHETNSNDIVYSPDDFDNNFSGLEEWVNPEDIA